MIFFSQAESIFVSFVLNLLTVYSELYAHKYKFGHSSMIGNSLNWHNFNLATMLMNEIHIIFVYISMPKSCLDQGME